jgi:hypothetical protein
MQDVTSLAANVSIKASGIAAFPATGTVQIQLKPSLLAEENLTISKPTSTLREIMSATTLYINYPDDPQPWAAIPLSGPQSAADQARLEGTLPYMLYAILLDQAQGLSASANVHAAGTQVIDGVSTTEYQGSLPPSAISAMQPAGFGQSFAADIGPVDGSISWQAWLDAQGHVRQIAETLTIPGTTTYSGTVTVTAMNEPATVALPPASQIQPGS